MRRWNEITGLTAALAMGLWAGPVAAGDVAGAKVIRRGAYLVTIAGCNDCHTPFTMGARGPAPDRTRLLSGHPHDLALPAQPKAEGAWMISGTATMTAWGGPWGVSYSANLTPDAETGLGRWRERNFVEAMRNGRHMGRGRPILPPMPYQNVAAMTEADLSAVFAYLRSIPAIRNRVPDPTPPAEPATSAPPATPRAER